MSNLFREGDRWVPSDGIKTDEITDGYHTFRELYDHRRALTAALARILAEMNFDPAPVWRTKAHHPDDPAIYDGFFLIGMELPAGTASYHYKLEHWDDFCAVPVLDHAPKWDGATPADTITRLLKLATQ